MPKFNNFKNLEDYIRDAIKGALLFEVVEMVKEVEIEVIKDVVYAVYPNPKQYVRRYGDEGLMDINNINAYGYNDGYVYSIVNETLKKGRGDYLAPLIEYGHYKAKSYGDIGYEHPRYGLAYMKPRPFTHKTYEELKHGGELGFAMKRGLKKRGIDVR